MDINRLQSFDDIEIRIFSNARTIGGDTESLNQTGYHVELCCADKKSAGKRGPLPYDELEQLAADPRGYGARLFAWLFEQDEMLQAFQEGRWNAESISRQGAFGGLRLRLWLDEQAPWLQTLRWEAMFDQLRGEPLSIDIAFSRFIRVRSPPCQLVAERPLRALLFASNAEGLPDVDQAEVNAVLGRMETGNNTSSFRKLLHLDRLVGRLTLDTLRTRLAEQYHILQFWAHAVGDQSQGYLVFSDETGRPQYVSFDEAARVVGESPPQLIFLITATDEKAAGIQEGLAPRLLRAGAQAVVAIQSRMEPQEVLHFTERFYDVLFDTGLIDVAVAEARNRIYQPESWDWARPTLYVGTPEAQLFQPLPEILESIAQSSAFAYLKGGPE